LYACDFFKILHVADCSLVPDVLKAHCFCALH